MKKAYIYTAIAAMAVLGSACSKNSAIDSFEGTGEYRITFGNPVVKATADDPVPDQNKKLQMTVYDYLTPASGTEGEYFNDKIQEATTSTAANPLWAFIEGSHAWKVGKHEFIGWVSTDELGNESGFSYKDKVLTLAESELPGEKNLDYRYASDKVVEWTKDLKDTPVELAVRHLSSALTYTFVNGTENKTYEVTGITVGGITTKAGATVTYGAEDGEKVVITPNDTKGDVDLKLNTENEQVKTMVWPQEVKGAILTVAYDVDVTTATVDESGEETTTETKSFTATIPVPETKWEAGKYYNFKIEVVDKSINLTLQVIPWDDWEKEVTYGTGTIATANALEYTSGAAVTTGGSRRRNNYFANASDPIVGYFSVYAPSDGQWKIKVTGDTDLLTVTSPQAAKSETVDGTLEISGPIVAENGSTGRVYFNIARATAATASNSVQLNFYVVTKDGREISINSEVTRRNALTVKGQYKGEPLDITGGTKNESGVVEFNAADTPITGSFSLFDPEGEKWVIRVSGDTDKLIVTSGSQTITGTVKELTGAIGTNPVNFSVTRGESADTNSKITLDFFTLKEEEGKEPAYTNVNHVVTKSGPMIVTGAIKE